MKLFFRLNLKRRIYCSFLLLVSVFVINGVTTIITLNNNKKLSNQISEILDPSLRSMDDFKKLILESKMYTTNWVFLRSNRDDKNALIQLHGIGYPALKKEMLLHSLQWKDKNWVDSLNKVYTGFEGLLVIEKKIMSSLNTFEDYNDPAIKLEAERLVDDEVLPLSATLVRNLNRIVTFEQNIKARENENLERSSLLLRMLITFLAITIICFGIFLSAYMTRTIIGPITRIRYMVNDLGKGIIAKVNQETYDDEIGEMVQSVNNLSQKLQATTTFASEVGNRNFDTYFEPLSDSDLLGKALLSMRENLKSSDERLNEAQHLSKLGSWERDIKNKKVIWSDELFQIFDCEPNGTTASYEWFLSFIHPDDKEHVRHITAEYLKLRQAFSYECKIITRKGVTKYIYVNGKVVTDEYDMVIKTYGAVQDITVQKESQRALENAHKEMKTLFSNIAGVFFSIDIAENKLLQMSPACENVLGYPVTAFQQNPTLWQDVILEEDKIIMANDGLLMKAGEPFASEYRINHKDGTTRWVETRITPTLSKEGTLIRLDGVISDISKRKKTEEALKANNAELKKTNMELDRFVYSVSHDLRAPLCSMLGVVEFSEQDTQDSSMLEYLGMIKQSIRKLDGFILDILNYSKNSRLEVSKEAVNFREMIGDITNNLKFMDSSNREVSVKLNIHDDALFCSDNYRVSVVLNNLISNAIRYQNPETEVPLVNINVETSDTEACIIVKDNGIGINKKFHQKIFDMFYRVSEDSVGSGLGLYIVKEAIDKLKGTIDFQSEPGIGTIFNIHLPNNN